MEHTEWYTKPCSVHGHCLLIGPSTGKHDFSLQMPIETANLIALACNAHKKLLALLEAAKCPCCDGSGGYYDNYGRATQCQWCCESKAAIAKAK